MSSPPPGARAPPDPLADLADGPADSLLDLVDHLLDQGVCLRGEVILSLAGVDLVYLRLDALLCAADRVLPVER